MNALRTTLSMALLALSASTVQAQSGITDIMRAGPSVRVPAANAQPRMAVQRAAEYIVALVNSEPITNTQVQRRLQRVLDEGNPQLANVPRDVLLRDVLEQIISERAQLQLAQEQGLRVDSTTLDQAEMTVAQQNNISQTELRRRLAQAGVSYEEFRNNLRDQVLLTRVRERELAARVTVSEREIDALIAEQRGHANSSAQPQLNIAQVLIAVPENASEAQIAALQKQASDIAARARGGEDFAKLAAEFSQAPDAAANGGAMGLRTADRYPSLFVEATQTLAVGAVTAPVRSGAGFHVLKLLERERASASADTITQSQARHILLLPDDRLTPEQLVERLRGFKRSVESGNADFAALAREHSQDTGSAREGGELGWTSPGAFVPEFEQALNALQPGQISEPVISRFGVHLIQLQGRREAKVDIQEMREAARNALRNRKMDQSYEAWAQEVRHRAYVELREAPSS